MKRFWTGLVLGILISIVVPLLVVASGVVNVAATAGPSAAEVAFARFAVRRSMAWRVPEATNPYARPSKQKRRALIITRIPVSPVMERLEFHPRSSPRA